MLSPALAHPKHELDRGKSPRGVHRYTEFKLRDFCAAAGLQVIDLHSYGGSLEVLADITGKHLAFSAPLSALHLAVAGALSRSPVGAKLRSATAARFPLGYLLVAQRHGTPWQRDSALP